MRPTALVVFALLVATPLQAQSLRDRFSQLFTFGDCGEALCLDVDIVQHANHFLPAVVQGEGNLLAFMTNAIGQAIGNVPFTASSSGVTFSFEGGRPVATSVSAGPIFADRAETLGQGRVLFGANVTGISFTKLRGQPLNSLDSWFAHEDTGAPPGDQYGLPTWERDVIQVTTNLDFSLLVTTLYATYGITDRLDVGIALPIVRSSLSGQSEAFIDWYEPTGSPHYFGDPNQRVATTETDGTAFGIGDITGRVKAFLAQGSNWGFGALADVRVPTGSEDDFSGSGAASFRLMGIGSARFGSFSPHLNAGALISTGDDQNNRVLSTLGFDQLIGEQVTFAADLVGSFQLGDSPYGLPEPVRYTAPTPSTRSLTDIPDKTDHFVDASFGLKIAANRDFRFVTNILIPLTDSGMRPSVAWTVGLERTF
jgi:hypothetical protein